MRGARAVALTALLVMVAALVAVPASAGAAAPERATLAVEGMTCAGCENTIESVLESMGGVKAAQADRSTDTVTVAYDAGVTAPARLVAAINDNTYYRASLAGAPAPQAAAAPSAAVSDPAPRGGGSGPALLLAGLGAAGCVALLGVRLRRRGD